MNTHNNQDEEGQNGGGRWRHGGIRHPTGRGGINGANNNDNVNTIPAYIELDPHEEEEERMSQQHQNNEENLQNEEGEEMHHYRHYLQQELGEQQRRQQPYAAAQENDNDDFIPRGDGDDDDPNQDLVEEPNHNRPRLMQYTRQIGQRNLRVEDESDVTSTSHSSRSSERKGFILLYWNRILCGIFALVVIIIVGKLRGAEYAYNTDI